jgi:hypothetical protein
VTTLDAATLEGFAALLALDGRSFASGAVSKKGLAEEVEADLSRFDQSIESGDEAILHFRKTDLVSWTVVEGLVLTSGAETYRVTKVMPDHSSPIQRLRCRVTTIT